MKTWKVRVSRTVLAVVLTAIAVTALAGCIVRDDHHDDHFHDDHGDHHDEHHDDHP